MTAFRTTAIAVVAASSLVLMGAGAAHSGQRVPGPAASLAGPGPAGWTRLPLAPIAPRNEYAAVWTGKQMIICGSSPASGRSAGHLEGFSYQPATGKWTTLPASPLGRGGRDSMLAVWTGSRLVVGGGATTSLQKDAAAYDPVTSNWTRLPDAPVGFEGNSIAPDIWTGASVITMEDGVQGGRPLSLDLTTRRWSLGPKAAVPRRQEAHEVWTGSQVLVWGGGVPHGIYCCQAVKQGYSYTP